MKLTSQMQTSVSTDLGKSRVTVLVFGGFSVEKPGPLSGALFHFSRTFLGAGAL